MGIAAGFKWYGEISNAVMIQSLYGFTCPIGSNYRKYSDHKYCDNENSSFLFLEIRNGINHRGTSPAAPEAGQYPTVSSIKLQKTGICITDHPCQVSRTGESGIGISTAYKLKFSYTNRPAQIKFPQVCQFLC